MTPEVPTADWEALFREMPVAIRQLRSHDAHCSFEAAELLETAFDVLRARDQTRAYDRIVAGMGELVTLSDRLVNLPPDTTDFLNVLADDLAEAFIARGEHEVIEELSRTASKKQA